MESADLIRSLKEKNIQLVAVSKKKPVSAIKELYDQGHRDFGENRVSELLEKYEKLPADIHWHMVGHLQSKKAKKIASFVYMIQSVDSLSLCETIDKQAGKNNRVIKVLLQIKIATEESKYGFDFKTLTEELTDIRALENIEICGVMGMASLTDNEQLIRKQFLELADHFHYLKNEYFADQPAFREISMGMSGDYKIAIDCGATMVRIGSLIFGPRP